MAAVHGEALMNRLREAVVATLKKKLPDMNVLPFFGLLNEDTEKQISYNSPGILVCALGAAEPDETIAPWELEAQMGLVVTVKAASMAERDRFGWEQTVKVANVVYACTWGIEQLNIRPAKITLLRKNDQRDENGVPTGQAYWTIQFYNWIKFEALLP
jgi:hypothetical protein